MPCLLQYYQYCDSDCIGVHYYKFRDNSKHWIEMFILLCTTTQIGEVFVFTLKDVILSTAVAHQLIFTIINKYIGYQ